MQKFLTTSNKPMPAEHLEASAYRKLVLLGAGATHLHIAQTLFQKKIAGLEVICIAQDEWVLPPALLPGVVAGQYTFTDSAMAVGKALERYGVQWIAGKVKAISASSKSIQLQDHQVLSFDGLSINTTPNQHRDDIEQLIPGARKNGFFVYPMERFARHWNQVCTNTPTTGLRISIVGGSLRSMEIALAVRQRLAQAAVTLIMQSAHYTDSDIEPSTRPARALLLQALKNQRISVLHDTALTCSASHVQLGCGAQLACDIPIIAIEPQKPAWLADNMKHIFFWSEEGAMDASPLLRNINANIARPPSILQKNWQTYYSGANRGVAQWGQHTLHGRLGGWLKHCNDRRTLQKV